MISYEQLTKYTNSLIDLKEVITDPLYRELTAKKHPVVKREAAFFISQIVSILQPDRILELGTNAGFSAVVMALRLKKGKIYTVDHRADHQEKAKENFIRFGVSEKIELLNGYALDILAGLDEKFDMIFIDADKKNYAKYLDYAVGHLNENGVILADNLFWKGSVLEEVSGCDTHPAVPTLSDFNKKFCSLKGFTSQIIPVGDGLGFAVKD
jgi:predicted O-methyltransferase YrrM